MRVLVASPLAAIAGLLLVTSCSKTSDMPTVQPAPSSAVTSAAAPVAASCPSGGTQPAAVLLTIAAFKFHPATLTAKVCQTVHVVNTDNTRHTWTAKPGPFGSPTLNKNDTYDYQFTAPGVFAFVCHFHDFMTGTITVSG